MKVISRAFLVFLVISWLPACAKKDKVFQGACQGVYGTSQQMHEMNHPDPQISPDREHPSYDQYEREREEMLGGDEGGP